MGKFLYPLPDEYYNVSDGYNYHGGHSYYDGSKDPPQHGLGKLDFTCPEGTEVRSMTPGTVVRAGSDNNGEYISVQVEVSGDYWPVNEGGTLIIRYYHITPSVSEGDTVAQGDVLGTVGDPDVTSSQHLHLDFASSTAPTLLKGRLTYNQLTDDQRTCLSTWYGQNTNGSSFESTFSNTTDAGGSSSSSNNGVGCWGRCWEVIATEATYESAVSSSSEGNANLPAGYMGSAAYDLSSKIGGFTDQDKHRVAYLCGREMGNGNYFESDSTKSTAGRCLYAFLIRAHFFERYAENLTGTEILDIVFAKGGFSGYTGSSVTYSYDDIDEIWNSFVVADTSNLTTQALSVAQYGPCCNYGWGAWYTATEASQEAITEACEAGNAPASNATWHLSLQFCGAYGNTSFHGPLNTSGFESSL